jgi:hypothetical protein
VQGVRVARVLLLVLVVLGRPDPNTLFMIDAFAARAVVRLMGRFPTDVTVQWRACAALANICCTANRGTDGMWQYVSAWTRESAVSLCLRLCTPTATSRHRRCRCRCADAVP